MKTGIESYDFSQKRMWRKWIWNRIKERLDSVPSKSVGLYLIGPNSEDLKIAIKKGFKKQNLIGVDINKENVKKYRNSGGTAICDKLQDILAFWPNNPCLDFINADFCCGFTDQLRLFKRSIFFSEGIGNNTVFAVNLLRGHDKIKARPACWLKDYKDGKNSAYEDWVFSRKPRKIIGDYYKHRGIIFFHEIIRWIVAINNKKDLFGEIHWNEYPIEFFEHYYNVHNPDFYSYKSISGNVMDSVVFKFNHKLVFNKNIKESRDSMFNNISSKISAAKAVRTMRM